MTSTHSQVQCPLCGSFDTRPAHDGRMANVQNVLWGGINVALNAFGFMAGRHIWRRIIVQYGYCFDNPQWVQRFKRSQVAAVCDTCAQIFKADTPLP